MAIAKRSSFTFTNQVRLSYVNAYFRKLLLWAKFAKRLRKDFDKTPGETLTIPVFTKMGAAQKPGEDDRLTVDSFGDKSFSFTVYEAAKAWGITDAGRVRMGSTNKEWEESGEAQAGRVLAEQVDADALAVLSASDGHEETDEVPAALALTTEFSSKKGADTQPFLDLVCNVRSLQDTLTDVFGDRSKEVMYNIMHSRSSKTVIKDKDTGLLKADANSPFQALKGYIGNNLLGKETFEIDNITKGKKVTVTDSQSASQKYQAYKQFFLKPQPYALVLKKNAKLEDARDILGRQDISAITQWYTFGTLHKKIDDDDIRAAGTEYITDEETT